MADSKVIRSTKHTTKFSNRDKKSTLKAFIKEAKRVANLYLEYLWTHEIHYKIKGKEYIFDISTNQLKCPNMLSNIFIEEGILGFSSNLSARAKKCILDSVLSAIRAATEKQRKRLYQYQKTPTEKLLKAIEKNFPRKPDLSKLNFELNSICVNFIDEKFKEFDLFIELKSLGKEFEKICIPIKLHRNNKKFADWTRMPSILLSQDFIDIRFSKEIPLKEEGKTLGADTGKHNVVAISDGQLTPKTDNHGHSQDAIMQKLARKRKGSKNFKEVQTHRENFIHWSINQLNFSNVKTLKIEKIDDSLRRGKRTNRTMSHWIYREIEDKLKARCEELGVQVLLQSSVYKSQRCSACELVKKSNRGGKDYHCECGFHGHADVNGACNNAEDLPEIPDWLRRSKLNLTGFYWRSDGFYALTGEALTVPPVPRIEASEYRNI